MTDVTRAECRGFCDWWGLTSVATERYKVDLPGLLETSRTAWHEDTLHPSRFECSDAPVSVQKRGP